MPKIALTYFYLDPKCHFDISFELREFLSELLTRVFKESIELDQSIKESSISYAFNVTSNSVTNSFELKSNTNISKKHNIINSTILIPNQYLFKLNDLAYDRTYSYRMDKYVTYVILGIEKYFNVKFNSEISTKILNYIEMNRNYFKLNNSETAEHAFESVKDRIKEVMISLRQFKSF